VLRPDEAGRFTFLPRGLRSSEVAAIWKAGGQDTLSDLRKRHIGYVLQTGGLLPYLTVSENIRERGPSEKEDRFISGDTIVKGFRAGQGPLQGIARRLFRPSLV
jgi:hypothetical protein